MDERLMDIMENFENVKMIDISSKYLTLDIF